MELFIYSLLYPFIYEFIFLYYHPISHCTHLSHCLSVFSISMYVYFSISVYFCLPLSLSICLSLKFYLFVCLLYTLSSIHTSIHLCRRPLNHLTSHYRHRVHPSTYPTFHSSIQIARLPYPSGRPSNSV